MKLGGFLSHVSRLVRVMFNFAEILNKIMLIVHFYLTQRTSSFLLSVFKSAIMRDEILLSSVFLLDEIFHSLRISRTRYRQICCAAKTKWKKKKNTYIITWIREIVRLQIEFSNEQPQSLLMQSLYRFFFSTYLYLY